MNWKSESPVKECPSRAYSYLILRFSHLLLPHFSPDEPQVDDVGILLYIVPEIKSDGVVADERFARFGEGRGVLWHCTEATGTRRSRAYARSLDEVEEYTGLSPMSRIQPGLEIPTWNTQKVAVVFQGRYAQFIGAALVTAPSRSHPSPIFPRSSTSSKKWSKTSWALPALRSGSYPVRCSHEHRRQPSGWAPAQPVLTRTPAPIMLFARAIVPDV